MGGRAALIYVIGFGLILGYINLNMAKLTSNAVSNMIGYTQITESRGLANMGANIALAKLTLNPYCRVNPLASQSFTKPPFAGGSFVARIDSTARATLLVTCVSKCTTNIVSAVTGQPIPLNDTVEVELSSNSKKSFSTMEWMTVQEGNIFFITGDTLWGACHSNGNIHIDGAPVFYGQVTTTGNIDPPPGKSNGGHNDNGVFLKGYETGVSPRPFPSDISDVKNSKTNLNADTNQTLYVSLSGGTTSDNDGKAYVRYGSWTNPISETISLSGLSDNVIYSGRDVHVKGTLDGRLSIASNQSVWIDSDIVYEKEPNPDKPLNDPSNSTTDMLGLVAYNNVIIADNTNNSHVSHEGDNDLKLDASIFCLTGSFEAENYNSRGYEGTIRLKGSIAQHDRGAVGNFSGNTINNGYLKNYKYDPRLASGTLQAPSFPGFYSGTMNIVNWWESFRKPEEFYSNFQPH